MAREMDQCSAKLTATMEAMPGQDAGVQRQLGQFYRISERKYCCKGRHIVSQLHPCYGILMDNITLYAYETSTGLDSNIKAEYSREGGLYVGYLTTVDSALWMPVEL